MKLKPILHIVPASLLAVVLIALGTASNASAAAPTLSPQISVRALTPQELKDYSLTGAQLASGLNNVGLGQPVYLDGLVSYAFPSSNILSVTWSLTNRPPGSQAALASSPLGPNVPPFKMADRYNQSGTPVSVVAGRTMLRPDVAGTYTVVGTFVTTTGTTVLTQTIIGGTYMGVNTCVLCHSGSAVAPNMMTWTNTVHATMFTLGIDGKNLMSPDGLMNSHYSGSCISCHTVGYDANTNAVNGGFDDIAKQLGWTFPPTLTNGNWAAVPPALKNLANIQCENCHGPGSQHAYSLGNTNLIAKSLGAGDCSQCHDSKNNHIKSAEWNNSIHARTTRTPSGSGRDNCVRCHTAGGFIGYANNLGKTTTYATNTVYEAITCQTCHDPHDASNPDQLRLGTTYALPDGTVVANAGKGGFCMNCHHTRNGAATNNVAAYKLGQNTWAGGSSFGVHDGPQGDMLEGVNAITYGKSIPSSAHRSSISDTCVGCHMQPVATTDPAFTQAGGHTFHMTYNIVSGGVTNTLDKVDVCVQCHGSMSSFDMVKVDYDGDGVIDGVQTEVQHLLNKLSTLLPNSTYRADGNYVADGLVKTPSTKTNWQDKFLNGAYNWQFVNNDGSKGVHNAQFAVGLIKASIADLTGDANNDGLSDGWQIQYFGSATAPNAAPNACPANDGIPNWLKFALGLNPTVPGMVLPDGVVYVNGTSIGGAANTIHIYTAAEVAFDTLVGTTYQVQAVSTLGGGWQNVGNPIAGTGTAVSYLTPMRKNVQQYFRVVHTP